MKNHYLDMKRFKFYHGTSTIFLDNIKRTGFGSVIPSIEYKLLDVLRYLYFKAERTLICSKEYNDIRMTTEAMVQQISTKVVDDKALNFCHDTTYLSISPARAANHVYPNVYGSEILQRCINLYKLLAVNKIEFEIPTEINLFGIDRIINCKPERIIVEISNVDLDTLKNEDGTDSTEVFDFITKNMNIWNEQEKYEKLQRYNFRLLKPMPLENLKFYKVNYAVKPGESNFSFGLIEY